MTNAERFFEIGNTLARIGHSVAQARIEIRRAEDIGDAIADAPTTAALDALFRLLADTEHSIAAAQRVMVRRAQEVK